MTSSGSDVDGVRNGRPTLFKTRNALLLGFGGLVTLLLLSGLDAVQVISQLRTSSAEVRRQYVLRSKQLEEIRSALYLSGTYVRDYLLEPDASVANHHRSSLNGIHEKISSELHAYGQLLRREQQGPFNILQTELDAYWKSLDPVLSWDARKRRESGYAFLRDEVFPRRTNMLGIANRIATANEADLAAGEQRVNEMFAHLRTRLLGVLAVTVLLGLIQAAVTTRLILRLERQTGKHLQDVSQARAELRDLSAKLVDAQEQERKSISRELHDAIGQPLSAVLLELRNLGAILPVNSDSIREHVEGIRRQIEGTVGMLRHMALLLRPSMLDDLGLIPALEWQARDVSRRTGMLINIAADEVPETLTDEQRTCIFRIVQEALNNITKHAEAKVVRIAVRAGPTDIDLSIQDDGKGFVVDMHKGLGLVGIQERVTNLGGTFRIESDPGRGTLLAVTVPINVAPAVEVI